MGNKIWRGERIEFVIETGKILMRKEIIRNKLLAYSDEKYKEILYDKGTIFVTQGFKIDYQYEKDIFQVNIVNVRTKNIYKSFAGDKISEIFDFLKETVFSSSSSSK